MTPFAWKQVPWGRAPRLVVAAAAAIAIAWAPATLTAQVRPDASWRTFGTEHFNITFEAGLEVQARRAAQRGEQAYARLRDALVAPPRGKIDLVVADNVDFANGFALLAPSNRITVYVHPPVDDFNLAFYDDWLELVITHELVHIFHLDETRLIGSVLRAIFGRFPAPWPFFPGLSTPTWTVEGLATYYESALTRSGRVRGTYLDMVVRTAVLEGRFESLDKVSGRSPVWPNGDRPYAYGALFFDHLAHRYGEDHMGEFVRAVAGQLIPYRLNAAARRAFGASFSEAWREWRAGLEAHYLALADSLASRAPLTSGEPLTHEGRFALYPRFSRDGAQIAFARSDGRSDAQIRVMHADGSRGRKVTRLNTVEPFDWLADGRFLAAQLDFLDPYRLTKDLYLVTAAGEVRLTRAARIAHADAAPDGRSAIAVQENAGTNRLVRVDLATGEIRPLTEYHEDVHWAFPRWSPDGRLIAASRWSPGAHYDVVVLDSAGRLVAQITDDRAVDMAPAWSPDARWLLWSSDRTGIANLYAMDVSALGEARGGSHSQQPDSAARPPLAPLRQVTNVLGGAFFPDVSPGGSGIAYSGYHADGWKIERIPFEPTAWSEPFPSAPTIASGEAGAPERDESAGTARAQSVAETAGRAYSPLRSLLPYFWMPLYLSPERVFVPNRAQPYEVIPGRFGALTGGRDLVGRHTYTLWAVGNPDGGWVEGTLDYTYAAFGNPVVGIAAEQEHDALGRTLGSRQDGTVDTLFITERERRLTGFATLLRPRVRSTAFLTLSATVVREDRRLFEQDLAESRRYRLQRPKSTLAEAAATVAYANPRTYAFSISPENGMGGFLRVRTRRELDLPDTLRSRFRLDRSFREITGQIRAFAALEGPGFANHVLAARVSGGTAGGPGADVDHFELGGASGSPEPLTGLQLFGGARLLFPVRGYPESFLTGAHAWSASLEYRFPLWLAHRGIGLWPAHLDRVAGSLFLDAGNAWGPHIAGAAASANAAAARTAETPLVALGAEISARVLPLWTTTLNFRFGTAAALTRRTGITAYLRIGQAF